LTTALASSIVASGDAGALELVVREPQAEHMSATPATLRSSHDKASSGVDASIGAESNPSGVFTRHIARKPR
jgi:hypothetical protein